jgi:2-keto-4-pentenoate hydratase/2-oxohepta-3-ene-1,7-dioic acid hydratase in catechol pathway
MKWLSFAASARECFGFVTQNGKAVDYRDAARSAGRDCELHSLLELVEAGPDEWAAAAQIAARIASGELLVKQNDLGQITYRAPIRRPSKIIGVAINNGSINKWAHRRWKAPGFFLKPPSALIGHGEAIVVRQDYGLTHPEPELAAVIGKRARDVSEDQALDHIFGFTIINDITSPKLKEEDSIAIDMPGLSGPPIGWRALQSEGDTVLYLTYHARSKGCDTFAPMGPWVTTADSITDPNALAISGWLGDQLVTRDSTAGLTFNVQSVISHASRYMTLHPGDIVHFGMAAKPAMPESYPTTWDLDISRLGASLDVEIEGIGRLHNPIERVA